MRAIVAFLCLSSTGCVGVMAWPNVEATPSIDVSADDVRAFRTQTVHNAGLQAFLGPYYYAETNINEIAVVSRTVPRQSQVNLAYYLGRGERCDVVWRDLETVLYRPGYEPVAIRSSPWWFVPGCALGRSIDWKKADDGAGRLKATNDLRLWSDPPTSCQVPDDATRASAIGSDVQIAVGSWNAKLLSTESKSRLRFWVRDFTQFKNGKCRANIQFEWNTWDGADRIWMVSEIEIMRIHFDSGDTTPTLTSRSPVWLGRDFQTRKLESINAAVEFDAVPNASRFWIELGDSGLMTDKVAWPLFPSEHGR